MLMAAGIGLIVLVWIDAVWSTLTTRGGGLVTGPVTTFLDRFAVRIHRLFPRLGVFNVSGPVAILALAVFWIGGLWLGWMLVFSALPGSVVAAQTGEPADTVNRLYFVGFTLSTLGVGDFKAAGHLSQVLTSLAAFNGLFLVTLTITYAVPLVSGVVARRKLAFSISILGKTPADLVLSSWNGENFNALESNLSSLSDDFLQNAEQRLAYPMLGSFKSSERGGAVGLQAVILDEALTLLSFGLEGPKRPDPPDLDALRDLAGSGLQLVTPEAFSASLQDQAERRRRLHQLVRQEGWDWSHVQG